MSEKKTLIKKKKKEKSPSTGKTSRDRWDTCYVV